MLPHSQMIIANWKMNLTLEEADEICKRLSSNSSRLLIIAVPTPYIAYLKAKYENLNFCAQDVSIKNDFGSYTGENSAKFFKSFGINYSIIGHSERRNLFGENNETIRQKLLNCISNDITPILCIGESLEIRKSGYYKEFLIRQLEECVGDIISHVSIIIAYEPVWAIGTKVIPSVNEISEIFDLIRNLDYKTQLVYGGSVNSENCKKLLEISNISGLLVGAASLDAEELLKILNS